MNDQNQSAPKTSNIGLWVILGVVVFTLVAGGAYLAYTQDNKTNIANSHATPTVNTNDASNTDTSIDTNTPTNTNSGNGNADWLLYENDDYGYSFRYPGEWGSVEIDIRKGTTGERFIGTFSQNDDILFGGATTDYSFPSEGGMLHTYGFQEDEGRYYCLFNIDSLVDNKREVTPLGLVNGINADGILVDVGEINDWPNWTETEQYSIVFNLNGNPYNGLSFVNKNISVVSQKQFIQMGETFRVR